MITEIKSELQKFIDYRKMKGLSCIYDHLVKLFLIYFKDKDVYNLDFSDFTDYILSLRTRLKNGTINTHIFAIKQFYSYCADNNLLQKDMMGVLNRIKTLPVEYKIRYSITRQQLNELIRKAVAHGYSMNPYKIKAILIFMFYTGVRKQELVNLKREDINLKDCLAFIRTPTKNKRERIVYFPEEVARVVSKFFSTEKQFDNAFNMSQAKMMHFFAFLRKFDDKVTPHSLRHSFTHMLMKHKVDSVIAQNLLGHRSINTTMLYYRPTQDIIRDTYRSKIRLKKRLDKK